LGQPLDDFTYYKEERVGQVTFLEPGQTNTEQVFAAFHQKTRNAARKALKSGFTIKRERLADTVEGLQRTHAENLKQIGGRAKPLDVFAKLDGALGPTSTSCYVAAKNGRAAAYLLLLYSGDTVEYFTPAIVDEFRSEQPLTALIVEAMTDAAASGYRRWNWGGTWFSQEGVYRFKSRFGARDFPYRYQVGVRDMGLLRESKEHLAAAFPYFFVVPYSALN
jgi:lipid II:glycine glycyltransferase (peptidoglycan interpeptide bridge formation enzyme)